jgi:hypothetical protein
VKKRERLAYTDKRDSQGAWLFGSALLFCNLIVTLISRPPGADRMTMLAIAAGFWLLWLGVGWRRFRMLPVLLLFFGSLMLWQGIAQLLFPFPGLPRQPLLAVLYGCAGLGAFYFAWRKRATTAVRQYSRVRFITNRYQHTGASHGMLGYVVKITADQSYEVEVVDASGNAIAHLLVQHNDITFDPPK